MLLCFLLFFCCCFSVLAHNKWQTNNIFLCHLVLRLQVRIVWLNNVFCLPLFCFELLATSCYLKRDFDQQKKVIVIIVIIMLLLSSLLLILLQVDAKAFYDNKKKTKATALWLSLNTCR